MSVIGKPDNKGLLFKNSELTKRSSCWPKNPFLTANIKRVIFKNLWKECLFIFFSPTVQQVFDLDANLLFSHSRHNLCFQGNRLNSTHNKKKKKISKFHYRLTSLLFYSGKFQVLCCWEYEGSQKKNLKMLIWCIMFWWL